MKGKLVKEYGDFYLISDKEIQKGDEYVKLNNRPRTLLLGTTISHVTKVSKLSLKNCEAIVNGYDLDELAKIETRKYLPGCPENIMNFIAHERFFKIAFEQAMELNKDKLFTVEDMKHAMNRVWSWMSLEEEKDEDCDLINELENKVIQSLQQPTEIEVEVEMDRIPADLAPGGWDVFPKLDAQGCLILKRGE